MEIFPFAHKVPKQITVLYSTEDGVVDGDTQWGDGEVEGVFKAELIRKSIISFSVFSHKAPEPVGTILIKILRRSSLKNLNE